MIKNINSKSINMTSNNECNYLILVFDKQLENYQKVCKELEQKNTELKRFEAMLQKNNRYLFKL